MLYLASSSPRRAELLRQIGVEFDIIHADIDESPRKGEAIDELVSSLSIEKAIQGLQMVSDIRTHDLVLAADTLIGLDGRIIGKPESKQHCCEILQLLSGKQHQVYSAVALAGADGAVKERLTVNEITFRALTEREIRQYCDGDEPMDKAGAYAIQGKAAMFIQHLSGSYSAVMGLPLYETALLLDEAGYRITGNKNL